MSRAKNKENNENRAMRNTVIKFSNSNLPFIRAGMANLFIPFTIIAAVFSYILLRDIDVNEWAIRIATISIVVFMMAIYLRALSRIEVGEDSVKIICSLQEISLFINRIERIIVINNYLYKQLLFIIFCNGRMIPYIFYAIDVQWTRDDAEKIKEKFLREMGQ